MTVELDEIVRNHKNTITHDAFRRAFRAFAEDLGIVGHPEDPTMSIFEAPREWGKYNLTLLPEDMREEETTGRLAKVKAIGVTCMDKRVARPFYKDLLADGYQPDEVALITVGGGIVQKGVERRSAMKTILAYLSQYTPHLEKAVITDHDHRCGAVAYWLKASAGEMPAGFGKGGGEQEKRIMRRLITEGVNSLVPRVWIEREIVDVGLVVPDEATQTATVELFDPQEVERPVRVEDLTKATV